jgi:hypothetical protein
MSLWREQHYTSLRCELCDPIRLQLFPPLNLTRRDALESHRSPRSTPVVENKREKKVLTGPKGTSLHVSAGLVWSLAPLGVTRLILCSYAGPQLIECDGHWR